MNKKEESDKLKISFGIGDLVVINSYPKTNPLSRDPLHVPPVMVVVGIEIENKKKKTHDSELGIEIGERVKYNLLWFDNKKSVFVDKIMYQKLLKAQEVKAIDRFNYKTDYKFGGKVGFVTSKVELLKKKLSDSNVVTKFSKGKDKLADNKKDISSINSLVTFTCPDLVISGGRKNNNKDAYDDFGNKNKIFSEILIKVMWFNPNLQKYSEYELPQECLNKI